MKGQTTNKTNKTTDTELENCKWKAQYSYDMSNYLLDSVRKLRGKNDVLKMKIEEQEKRLKLYAVSIVSMALALLIHIFC